ncbi:hypothetical protein B0H14DRAFT_2812309, partial [Mycena olivaceomarginata]
MRLITTYDLQGYQGSKALIGGIPWGRTSRSSGLCLISSCRTSSTTSMGFRSGTYLPFLSLPLAPYPLPPITSLPPSPSPSAMRQPPTPRPASKLALALANLTVLTSPLACSLSRPPHFLPPADERAPPLRVHGHLRRHAAHDPQAVPVAEDDGGYISRCVVFVFMPSFLVSFWSWVWDSVLGVLLREVGGAVL